MSEVISTKKAAAILGISGRAVRALLERGTLEGQKLETEWAVSKKSVLAYKAQKEAKKAKGQ